jgi:hypothetical protein
MDDRDNDRIEVENKEFYGSSAINLSSVNQVAVTEGLGTSKKCRTMGNLDIVKRRLRY